MRRRVRGLVPAIVCGLGLAASLGCATVAKADEQTFPTGEYANEAYANLTGNTSTGETNLYLVSGETDTATSEGSNMTDLQMRVTLPVGIHYVALKNGKILGPSDGTVMFRNKTTMSAVHIAGIAVSESGQAKIVKYESFAQTPDTMYLSMRPVLGHMTNDGFTSNDANPKTAYDEFGNYVGTEAKSPIAKYQWDMPANACLSLFELGGHMSSFNQINPLVDTHIGTVHWTVRLGTRAEADERDSTVTVRYHPNGGLLKAGAQLEEQRFVVVDPESLPEIVADEDVLAAGFLDATDIVEKNEARYDGSIRKHVFSGWSLDPNGEEPVECVSDIGEAKDIAGKSFTLYANYEIFEEDDGD